TLLVYLTTVFAATTGVVDYATLKPTFDGWYWATRAARLLKKWQLTLPEWQRLIGLTPGAQLLDFLTLPLNSPAAIAPADRFLRTSRIIALRDSLPEIKITFFDVLETLDAGSYSTTNDFATDVEHFNDASLMAYVA